ncbi:hypothetical protein AMTR_s00059p00199230 [Amborella trichopoda]|uniref:Cytochrome P450 n=1 Tax=Amborella trichopoda TaxID=13333 RepID=U5CWH1_AMBTC|nr:hypothetical protein AMTR_s00059p00199230 [Amborella trichopoda]
MRVLVISSHDLAKECFTGTNDQVFATSPRTTAGRLKAYDHALTAFSAYGPHWRQSRKLAILNLLCAHKVESFFHVQSSEVDMTIRQLYRMWVENHSEPAKGVMQWWLGNLTVNIMARIEGVGRGDEPFDWRHGGFRCVPFLGWIDFQGRKRAMRRVAQEVDSIIEAWGWQSTERSRHMAGARATSSTDYYLLPRPATCRVLTVLTPPSRQWFWYLSNFPASQWTSFI